MITYDDLPLSAQKKYNQTNRTRKVTMFIGLGCAALFFMLFFIMSIVSSENIAVFLASIVSNAFASVLIGGILHGFVHFAPMMKRIFKKVFLLAIIWIVPGIMLFTALLMIAMFTGGIFLVIDTILYKKKKPLIYKHEMKHFLETEEAQQELEQEYNDALIEALNNPKSDSEVATENLKKIKEMLDNGIITHEEFDIKKSELLERI